MGYPLPEPTTEEVLRMRTLLLEQERDRLRDQRDVSRRINGELRERIAALENALQSASGEGKGRG